MSEDDFKKLVGKVKPVKSTKVSPEFNALISDTHQKELQKQKRDNLSIDVVSELDTPMVTSEEILSFIKLGGSNKVLKKLRQENYPIVLEIDLHHMTEEQAKKYLLKTLNELSYLYPVSIKVIHGKARSVDRVINYPVLKNMIVKVLFNHCKVIAYTSCTLGNGGAGATLVLLSY